jgi:hypothetical protein
LPLFFTIRIKQPGASSTATATYQRSLTGKLILIISVDKTQFLSFFGLQPKTSYPIYQTIK